MTLRRLGRSATALVFTTLLSACAQTAVAATGVHVGMVLDVGGLGDRSFNDAAYKGLGRCALRLGVDPLVRESETAAAYKPNLDSLAAASADEILAVGYSMDTAVAAAAKAHPDRHFTIVDTVVEGPNITSLTFKEEQGSFLAGALAAMMSQTHRVAFFGGFDLPVIRKFEVGYVAGARTVDPTIVTDVRYAGTFDDVAKGRATAEALAKSGADVIFSAAGRAGLGTIESVKAHKHLFAIGVDSNQDALVPGRVLTSMLKRVDTGVDLACTHAAMHEAMPGHIVLGLRENGVGLTDFTYTRAVIGPERIARLEALRAAIVAGKIVPPSTREELKLFHPPA
jgi:basic membrane protein A